jgi:hypothetical protein
VSAGRDRWRVVVDQTATDTALESLVAEIEKYLAVVDAFRREGRDPTWEAEGVERQPWKEV